jgi:hypothetical protein
VKNITNFTKTTAKSKTSCKSNGKLHLKVSDHKNSFEIHQNRSKVEIDNREKILQLLKMGSSLI